MGSSDSESGGSDSGRSHGSYDKDRKDKKHKKGKKDKKDGSGDEKDKKKDKKHGSGDEKKVNKDKKDKHGEKDKKDKKDDKHKDDKKTGSQLPTQVAHALSGTSLGGLAQEFLGGGGGGHGHGLFREGPGAPGAVSGPGPAPGIPSNPPTGAGTGPSGQRIPCTTTDPFPAQAAGPAPPFVDSTGQVCYITARVRTWSNPAFVARVCWIGSDR
jgi:hypothetical protein